MISLLKTDLEIFSEYFAVIFPIITFLLGFVVDRTIDYFIERRRINRAGNRWMAELKFLDKPIGNQIEYIDEFLTEHIKNEFKTPAISTTVQLKGDTFKALDKGELYSYLVRKQGGEEKAIETGNKIAGHLLIMEQLAIQLEERFNSYMNNGGKWVDIFKENLNKLLKESARIVNESEQNGVSLQNDQMLTGIHDLMQTYIFPYIASNQGNEPQEPMELFNIQENFLVPMLHHLTLHRADQRSRGMTELVSVCNQAITEIRLEKDYLTENLNKIRGKLEQTKDQLQKLVSEID